MSDPIRIIREPSVYLIARQQIDENELSRFLADNGTPEWKTDTDVAAERIVEIGGRLCYSSYAKPRPGGNKAYIDHIRESGHGSVCEHAVFTLLFTGISRSCSHELIRHRTLSPSELSQRYVDCEDVAFVVPPAMMRYYDDWLTIEAARKARTTDIDDLPAFDGWEAFDVWRCARRENLGEYAFWTGKLADDAPAELTGTERRKWARQAARSVLPNCTETRIMMTANVRAWRSTLEQRASRHSDAEIRRLFGVVYDVLLREANTLFSDYTVTLLSDGSREITTTTRKI